MTDEQRRAWEKRLHLLKRDLEHLEKASREASKPVALDQTSVGRVSRIDAMQSQQMAIEGERRRKEQLVRIEGALRRLSQGEFGICFSCKGAISDARLAIDPTATRCVSCA